MAWQPKTLKECGYRHLRAGSLEAFVDVGGIAATYQAGHSHADALNYELRIGGKPFIVDTGISTYDKTPRRQYERSAAAHNTVTVDGKDTTEVWGGFRVGRRSSTTVIEDRTQTIIAQCSGTSGNRWHLRQFNICEYSFSVEDTIPVDAEGISRIHFSPDITIKKISDTEICTDIATVCIVNAVRVEVREAEVSTAYNRLRKTAVVEIHFKGGCSYDIRTK